jgi:hypothetical protein
MPRQDGGFCHIVMLASTKTERIVMLRKCLTDRVRGCRIKACQWQTRCNKLSNHNPPTRGWKPGQSGNPKGGPKRPESLTGLLREYMNASPNPDDPDAKPRKEAFIQAVAKHAIKGDATLIKYLWDRLDGPMKQELLAEVKTITVRGPKPPEDIEPDTPAPIIITPEANDE